MHEPIDSGRISRGPRPLASKWIALFAGLCFAIPGLLGVLTSVPLYGKFATRTWMEIRSGPGNHADPNWRVVRLSDSQHGVIHDGFEPGGTALFSLFCFVAGIGVAAFRFLDAPMRQNLWLLLGMCWHGLGIATLMAYMGLAPRPLNAMPLVAIGVYEWAGVFLIALGVRKAWFAGHLHEAAWNLWAGGALGGVAGAIVGALIDFVRFNLLRESSEGGFAVRFWIYGGLLGGVVTGIVFVAWTLSRAFGVNEQNRSPLARGRALLDDFENNRAS